LRPILRVGNAPVIPGLFKVLAGFDIIHLHYPFFGGEMAALAAKWHRTPLVITYHQDVCLRGPLALAEKTLRWTVERLILRAAGRLLFTSQDYGRASYARRLLRGREHCIGELPNGVDTGSFSPRAEAACRHTPSTQNVLLVASLDQAHYFKGVHIFLQALAQLPATVQGIVVGDGDLRRAYEATAVELEIAPRVRFTGRVSNEELADYYRLADVTVLPSVTMGEAFGMVLLESLASGTPVVASSLPGVRTLVDHGGDGLLVTPNDPRALAAALQELLGDETRRCQMGMHGRAKVTAAFDWSHIGARLEAIYGEVLNAQEQRCRFA
jgi:glycosyltransferase involved in cell wall biosynthesis